MDEPGRHRAPHDASRRTLLQPDLMRSWQRAWAGLGGAGGAALAAGAVGAEDTFAALLARYEEPGRAYHTLQHLAECLALFEQARAAATQAAAVEMALWFHDAIYDPRRKDNEDRSAQWARQVLAAAGVRAAVVEQVAALVLATRHVAPPEGADAVLLVDIDLAILGAAPQRFEEYERQIRAEYAFVPAAEFALRRRAVLGGFLARPAIYGTPFLSERLEARARHNLSLALSRLPGGPA